jgi:hypothetical protein
MNLCSDCKFANWKTYDEQKESDCLSFYKHYCSDKNNYVTFCSMYETKSVIKRIWINFIRKIK